MYNIYLESKICLLEIICDNDSVLGVYTVSEKKTESSNKICLQAKLELEEYFLNKRNTFDVPLKLTGTDFQKRVWQELINIPFGEVISYQELANRIGNPKAVRAVANAVGDNKLLIIIPCHRIIGTDNSLTGFGAGLDNKIILLKIEGLKINLKDNLRKSKVIKKD